MDQDSLRASILTLMSAAVGPGALLLPYSFRLVGIPCGIVLMLLGVYCTAQSLRLLLTLSHATGTKSYSAAVAAVFGPGAGLALTVLMSVVNMCGTTANLMFLVDLTRSMLPNLVVSQASLMVLWAVLVSPACLLRDITSLRNFAPVAPLGLVVVTLLVVWRAWCAATLGGVVAAGTPLAEKERRTLLFGDGGVWGVPRAWAIIAYALTCHHIAVPVLRVMRKSMGPRINKAVGRTVVLMGLLYAAIALCGFLAFGSSTPENVLRAWPQDSPSACLGRLLVGGSLMVGIPLCVNADRAQVMELLPVQIAAKADQPGSPGYVFVTALMLAVPTFVGTICPSVTSIVNITCGFGMMMYMYVVPAVAVSSLRCQVGRASPRGVIGHSDGAGALAKRMLSSPVSSPLLSPRDYLVRARKTDSDGVGSDNGFGGKASGPVGAQDPECVQELEFECEWSPRSCTPSSPGSGRRVQYMEAGQSFEVELEWSPKFALVLAVLSLGTVMGFAAAWRDAVHIFAG